MSKNEKDFIELAVCKNCINFTILNGKGYCNLYNNRTEITNTCASFEESPNKIIEVLEKENDFSQEFSEINDKFDIAYNLYKKNPFFYDVAKIWWIWDVNRFCWSKIDEIDLFNIATKLEQVDTVNSQERQELFQALKQVGRMNSPEPPEPSWIQFKDVIYDIYTKRQHKSIPRYFMTNPIPWSLGVYNGTPTIDKLFSEWVGEEYKELLYEIIAYCLLADYPIHRIFCVIGEGLNGKSKFLELLSRFVGKQNTMSTDLELLISSRFEVAKLYKKLVCVLGETDFNEISKTGILKKLTGQDMVGFEFKNKDGFDAYNYAKIIIATNNLPATTDKTDGYYRRWVIIDFPNQFSDGQDILKQIPLEEYENLGRRCVEILPELLKKGAFHKEGTISERKQRYEDKSNPFDKFYSECIIEDMDNFIFKFEFKDKFNAWCKDNRFRQHSDIAINEFMKKKGIITGKFDADWFNNEGKKPRYNAWSGIRWK